MSWLKFALLFSRASFLIGKQNNTNYMIDMVPSSFILRIAEIRQCFGLILGNDIITRYFAEHDLADRKSRHLIPRVAISSKLHKQFHALQLKSIIFSFSNFGIEFNKFLPYQPCHVIYNLLLKSMTDHTRA